MREVWFEDKVISYELTYKDVKNVNLRIKPTGEISVSVNKAVSPGWIDDFVRSKGYYILRSLDRFKENEKYAPKAIEYTSGEEIRILGSGLRLVVLEGRRESIESDGVCLFLTVKDKEDFARKKSLIEQWTNKLCRQVFDEIADAVYMRFKKYGVSRPLIKIRWMKSRWGSCLPIKGIITLNARLIEKPRNCIEYVVLHEFCHFIHPNHSKKFRAVQ